MSLNKPKGHGGILNFIKIDREICEKMSAEVLVSLTAATLNGSQGHSNDIKQYTLVVRLIVRSLKVIGL